MGGFALIYLKRTEIAMVLRSSYLHFIVVELVNPLDQQPVTSLADVVSVSRKDHRSS